MKTLLSASAILFALSLSSQSMACDRHGGGGMFGQLNRASWSEYNPSSSGSEAELLEQQMSEWRKQNAAAKAKPTFSKASTRASMAAQTRLAQQAKLERIAKANATTSVVASENSSEMAPR